MKNSFIKGAAILMAANAVSKILGAVLKIPLTYIIHEEGMAVYNTAFSIYAMMLSFVISGIPFAVTKLTAGEIAKKNPCGAKSIVRYATLILLCVGAIGTAIMWFGAEFFALALKEPRAVSAIRAISPSVFFVAWGAAAKSGFQGGSDMTPTAVSQCIESVIKLLAGYFLAVWLLHFGTEISAAGAIAGVTIGEIAATAMLVIWYYSSYKTVRRERGKCRYYTNELISTALPVLFMAVVGSAISVIDTSVLRASLIRSGLSEAQSRYLYGAYTGYAMTVLNLPSGLLATLGVSIIPVVSASAAVGNMERIRSVSKKGLMLSGTAGLCAAAVIASASELILQILFKNTASAMMLRISAPSVFFICIMQLSAAILQAMGYTYKTFISSLAVGIIKLFAAIFLVSQPKINIYGAAIGADFAFCTGMIMNLLFLAGAGKGKALEINEKV